MLYITMIDWGGPILSGEQMQTLRNILSLYLKRETKDKRVSFSHLLIEGSLTFRGPTTYGTFVGNRFFVDFGSHNGAPWYIECLLPQRSEWVDIPDDSVVFSQRPHPDGSVIEIVDLAQCRASDDNLL